MKNKFLAVSLGCMALASCATQPQSNDDEFIPANPVGSDETLYQTGFNPILPPWEHIPDGEPRVFGNRVYLYGSHDNPGSTVFCDTKYRVWSASLDSLNYWYFHGDSFHTVADDEGIDDVPWSDNYLYAPDVVEKDGKYYLYAYVVGAPGCVAVSDNPGGPFKTISKYKAPEGAPADFGGWGQYIDPGVLVDDDGRVYIYWGYKGSHMAEINPENMYEILPNTYIKDIIPTTEPFNFFEAASMRKINGKYYFIYADGGILVYATSDKPIGPFEYGGPIIRNGIDYPGGNNHGSLCQINGQWYIFYHRMTNNTIFSRKACVERVNIEPDGSIKEVEMTSLGFNESLDPYKETPAYAACVLKGGNYITQVDTLTHPVINNKDNCVIGFKYYDFGKDANVKQVVKAKVMPKDITGQIEVWIDGTTSETGKMVAVMDVPAGKDWSEISAPMENVVGRHAVYFRMKAGQNDKYICDFLSFIIDRK